MDSLLTSIAEDVPVNYANLNCRFNPDMVYVPPQGIVVGVVYQVSLQPLFYHMLNFFLSRCKQIVKCKGPKAQ